MMALSLSSQSLDFVNLVGLPWTSGEPPQGCWYMLDLS